MFKISKLTNGLTLITVDLPHLDSVTSNIVVGAGSRYETPKTWGLSHFLEHMFFKGSEKYPSAELIASMIDGMGAVNNAATSKEFTYYWIKSSSKNLDKAIEMLSSMITEPLFEPQEIEREKGVIVEEMRMRMDNPQSLVWRLFEELLYGDQPLGRRTIGTEESVNAMTREDFIKFQKDYYSPHNMAILFVGKLPKNINDLAEKYFSNLPKYNFSKPIPVKIPVQKKPRVSTFFKETDQVNVIFGTLGFDIKDQRKYAAEILATVLGEGMSSRLFIQVREKRGLAYGVMAEHDSYTDTGNFAVMSGLKKEKAVEGVKVIKDELEKMTSELISSEELQKAKEMIRGHLAIRSESTNFLATQLGVEYILEGKLETFEEYLKKIDEVTAEDVRNVAKELFKKENYNLQIVGPVKETKSYEEILNS